MKICTISTLQLGNISVQLDISALQLEEVLQPNRVVGSTQSADRIVALDSRETLVAARARATVTGDTTESLVTDSDIVKEVLDLLVECLVQSRVDPANRTLADAETLLVDASEDTSDNGSRHGSSSRETGLTLRNNQTVVAKSRNVGVSTSSAVVFAAGRRNDSIRGVVGKVVGVMAQKVTI